MKLRFVLISLVVLALVLPSIAIQAQNATVTEQTPAERCSLAQNYIKNIQRPRDLRARVDRLQAYRYIQQRLEVFVVRLEKNNQPQASEMRSQLNELNEAIESFKNDYEAYDKAREAVSSSSNCRTKISEFQGKLAQARARRQTVHEDVLHIQRLLSPEISGQLVTLKQALELNRRTTND